MSNDANYRVLLVDDDAALCQALACVLSTEGFLCDHAANGATAAQLMAENCYDALVTDLRMPMLNGHALSVATLSRNPRPLVIVLTGVVEPRLAADLLIRGVDDVVFKPVYCSHVAAKLKALLARRVAVERHGASGGTTVSAADLDARLANVRYALPISRVALDVVRMTTEENMSTRQLADLLSRDASLAVEVLRLANCQFYTAAGQRITDLEEAIVRIGTRRVAEVASATSALVGIAARTFTWMDSTLLCQQSVASGVAMGLLLRRVPVSDHGGLFIAALTQGLGRVVLATLYPGIYELLTRSCAVSGECLLDEEDRLFPSRHAEVMAAILAKWGFPPGVVGPLRHALSGYDTLQSLSEPLRTKVELCKIAAIVGRVAIGRWEPWDVIEPTPASVLAKLNLQSINEIVEQTRINLHDVDSLGEPTGIATVPVEMRLNEDGIGRIGYVSLSSQRGDILPEILGSMGLLVHLLQPECLAVEGHIVVNCIEVPAKRLAPYLGSGLFADSRLIVTDARHAGEYQYLGGVVSVPKSYAAVQKACERVSNRTLEGATMIAAVLEGESGIAS